MSFSERINTPELAMALAQRNRKITAFMEQNPDLAVEMKKVMEDANKAAKDSGAGALDAMNKGHEAIIDKFPQIRQFLGLDEKK